MVDGTYIDINGQTYHYSESLNQWTRLGAADNSSIVSSASNGLITPAILSVINQLESLNNNGNLKHLKISTNDVYWYLLNASNKYYETSVSGDGLNIELDKYRLINKLQQQCGCAGKKGQTGLAGEIGLTGADGPSEHYKTPIINNTQLTIDDTVDIITDTNISLRLYKSTTIISEIIIDLIGRTSIINYTDIQLSVLSASLSGTNLNIIIQSSEQPDTTWQYKLRQIGFQGDTGPDGDDFIEIVSTTFNDTKSRRSNVLRLFRNLGYDIYTIFNNISTILSVSHLKISEGFNHDQYSDLIITSSSAYPDCWASVEPTISTHKSINKWSLHDKQTDVPQINIPYWTPTKNCGGTANFELNWFDNFTIPFTIKIPNDPASQCCQDDFFICPNVADGPCPIEIVGQTTSGGGDGTNGGGGNGDGLPLHAPTHQHGGNDEIAVANPSAFGIPKADGDGKLSSGWIKDASTTQAGKITTEEQSLAGLKKFTDGINIATTTTPAAQAGNMWIKDGILYFEV